MYKLKQPDKMMAFGTSPIIWQYFKSEPNWYNKIPEPEIYTTKISPRYTCHIYAHNNGWSWTLRDDYNHVNAVLPGIEDNRSLQNAIDRSVRAYLLMFAVNLIRPHFKSRDMEKAREFYFV